MKTKLLSLCLVLMCAAQLFAYDAYIDGIYYNLHKSAKTAEVTNLTGSYDAKSYSGVVVIPSTITYNAQTYSVTTIGDDAFYGCSGLTKTNYTGTIADWCEIKFGMFYANPMYYSKNFFINDVEVKDLVIPEGVKQIGYGAFSNCSNLKYLMYVCKMLSNSKSNE